VLSWKCIDCRISFNKVFFWTNAIFNKTHIVERIINLVKPAVIIKILAVLATASSSDHEFDLPVKEVFYNVQAISLCFFTYLVVC
jgi:hypothetical protein